MIKVGITGGIGSGKSTVVEYLKYLGYPVFIADVESKKILFSDKEVFKLLTEKWGDQVLESGEISRLKLTRIVFSNKEELEFLNSVLHPRVANAYEKWLKEQNSPVVFKEVAILFETGGDKMMDFTVNVSAPEDIRLKRVMRRDKVSKEDVLKRMRNQFSEERRNDLADFIIISHEELVIPQVNDILKKITLA